MHFPGGYAMMEPKERTVIFLATLDDIARELGVSKGTVSKALNGAKDVSRKTQKSVLEKAVEMGYTRISRGTEAPRMAVFIMNMDYASPQDFGYDIVVGFRQAAEPAGYHVDIIPLDTQTQLQVHYDEYMMRENYCGGVFLGLCLLDPWLREFETCNTPTVLYDNHVSCNPNVTSIGVDIEEGMELAIRHLTALGHTRIGYLSGALDSYVFRRRYEDFIQAMQSMGLSCDEKVMGNSFLINSCISQHLPRLLENGCTAIVCSHDMLAYSVMLYCLEQGLRIPEDVSVLGHDDILLCRYTTPPLATIRQNRSALGKSAFFALLSQQNGVPLSSHLLHAELMKRGSCGPAPQVPYTFRPREH